MPMKILARIHRREHLVVSGDAWGRSGLLRKKWRYFLSANLYMWCNQWTWKKSFLYKSKGAEEGRLAKQSCFLCETPVGSSVPRKLGSLPAGLPVLVGSHVVTPVGKVWGHHGSQRYRRAPFCAEHDTTLPLWHLPFSVKWLPSLNSKCEGISSGKWTQLCLQVSDMGWAFKACAVFKESS